MISRNIQTDGELLKSSSVQDLQGQRVLVIGDLMLDAYCIGDADRISPEAPVPVVKVEKERHVVGGAGNVARNIAALGGKPTMIGIIGDDHEGEILSQLMEKDGIESCLVTIPGRPTTVKTRIMARKQQMLRLDREETGPITSRKLDDLFNFLEEKIPAHDVIILSDYNKGVVSAQLMNHLRDRIAITGRDIHLLVDPKPVNIALYHDVFLMTPNTRETGECAGFPVQSPREILVAGRWILRQLGCQNLLTTLGADGMVLFSGIDSVWHIPTCARDVFDVTGAGDTVIATLGLALASGHDMLSACMLANYAAGLVVARVGAATVSPEQLIDAIAQLPPLELTRWD